MSKSKRNTVAPDDIIDTYGADAARLFMLSDSPPERDVNWTEEGVAGRLAFRAADVAAGQRGGRIRELPRQRRGRTDFSERSARGAQGRAWGARERVGDDIEKLRFNRCIAHIYEFANALQDALASRADAAAPDLACAVREAAEILVQLFHPMMPHLAEECWAALGHDEPVGACSHGRRSTGAAGRGYDHAAGSGERQKAGRRDDCARRRQTPTSKRRSLLSSRCRRALDGKTPRKIIIVPQRIVNVVA